MSKCKTVIVINGKGGVGKDTICEAIAKHYRTVNYSSITPAKEMAKIVGWVNAKDDKSRKFLVDLKALCIDYNDHPTNYMIQKLNEFLLSEDEVFFAHIREADEIEKFVKKAKRVCGDECKVCSLLVRRKTVSNYIFGNNSDDNVEDYSYDYIYNNDLTLADVDDDVLRVFDKNILHSSMRMPSV